MITRSYKLPNNWKSYQWWIIILVHLVGPIVVSIHVSMIVEIIKIKFYISVFLNHNTSFVLIKILLRKWWWQWQDQVNFWMDDNWWVIIFIILVYLVWPNLVSIYTNMIFWVMRTKLYISVFFNSNVSSLPIKIL